MPITANTATTTTSNTVRTHFPGSSVILAESGIIFNAKPRFNATILVIYVLNVANIGHGISI